MSVGEALPVAGDVFRVRYPFVRCLATVCGEDGPYEINSWRPGVEIESCGPYGEDTDIVANGEGEMILTVIDVHKPGRFPTRIFFTRQFISPDGNAFGKGGLRMTTVDAFKRRTSGYRLAYDVEDMGPLTRARDGETNHE
jgi:hypothetical protein